VGARTVAAPSAGVPDGYVQPGSLIDRLGLGAEIWARLGLNLDQRREDVLKELVFLLVKPDAVAAGKGHAVFSALDAAGLRFLHLSTTYGAGEATFEELYKFNLTVRNEKNMVGAWWLNRRLYTLGPSVAVLAHLPQGPRGRSIDDLTELKGPSNPYLAKPGQLRRRLAGTNLALNLVHSSDDALSSAREFLLFESPAALERAFDRLFAPAGPHYLSRADWSACLDVTGRGSVDLDAVRVLTRLKLRLLGTVRCETCAAALERHRFRYQEILRGDEDVRTAWWTHREICDAELVALRACPGAPAHAEPALLLADYRAYDSEAARRLWAGLARLGFHTTEWEQVVVDTTMFYAYQFPGAD